MAKNFKELTSNKNIVKALVGAKILDIKHNPDTGRFVLILDNHNIIHVGTNFSGNEVVLSKKKY